MTTKQLAEALAYGDAPLTIILRDGTVFPHQKDGEVVALGFKDDILAMATENDEVLFTAAEDVVGVRSGASKKIYRDWFSDAE